MTSNEMQLAKVIMNLSSCEAKQVGEGLSSYVTRRSGGMLTINALERSGIASRKTLGRWLCKRCDKLDLVIDGLLVDRLRRLREED